jgi:hypothetical protein
MFTAVGTETGKGGDFFLRSLSTVATFFRAKVREGKKRFEKRLTSQVPDIHQFTNARQRFVNPRKTPLFSFESSALNRAQPLFLNLRGADNSEAEKHASEQRLLCLHIRRRQAKMDRSAGKCGRVVLSVAAALFCVAVGSERRRPGSPCRKLDRRDRCDGEAPAFIFWLLH